MIIGMLALLPLVASHAATPGWKTGEWANIPKEGDEVVARAATEGKVSLLWSADPEELRSVIAAFRKRFPFVEVEHLEVEGAIAFSRLRPQFVAGKVLHDLVSLGGTNLPDFNKEKMLASTSNLPRLFPWITKQLLSAQGGAGVDVTSYVLAFNPTVLKSAQIEAPKSIFDLADERFKERIGVDSLHLSWFANLHAVYSDEEVIKLFKGIARNQPRLFRGIAPLRTALGQGEVGVGYIMYHHFAQLKQKKSPVQLAKGLPLVANSKDIYLLRNAPHANAATLFLAWLLTEEGQDSLLKTRPKVHPLSNHPVARVLREDAEPAKIVIYQETADEIRKAKQLELEMAKILGIALPR
jgi:iron(III) transport system substrate-binding protein